MFIRYIIFIILISLVFCRNSSHRNSSLRKNFTLSKNSTAHNHIDYNKNQTSGKINSNEIFNSTKINLVGTFNGGCGFSVIAKKKIMDEIKNNLVKIQKFNENEIEVKLVNFKVKSNHIEQFEIPNKKINFSEFNVFLFYKHQKILIGTSDYENKKVYFEYLKTTLGVSKNDFYENITAKISKKKDELDRNII